MMFANTTSTYLIISSLFLISMNFFTYVGAAKSKGKLPSCDKNGKCKYGGYCDVKTNTCLCSFRCPSSLWDTSLYCGPKKPGQKAIFFKNICQVAAYACENQEDVHIIKYVPSNKRGKTTPRKFCRTARRQSEQVLCSRPEDFQGQCGGNLGPQGNINSGICLKTKMTGQKSCVCPASKRGENCQDKNVKLRSVSEFENDTIAVGKMSDLDKVAVFASISTFAILLAVGIFVKRQKTNDADSENVNEELQTPIKQKSASCVKIVSENNNFTTSKVAVNVIKTQNSKFLFSKQSSLSTKLPGKVIMEVKQQDKGNKTNKNCVNDTKKKIADV